MTSTFLRSVELTTPGTFTRSARFFRTFLYFLGVIAAMIAVPDASAQTQAYSCFPSCDETDARFLSIAGANLSTLTNSEIVLKIGSPGVATAVDIAFFDGETGGMWDYGNAPLRYVLFADPTGEGTGTKQVANWSGAQMDDNAWTTFTVQNDVAARAPNGNFLYRLVVTPTSLIESYMANFKVRTNGSVSLKAQAFSVTAGAISTKEFNVIYPEGWSNVTSTTPTTYDGSWRFFLDVQTKGTTLSVWDGDMDFGSFDCSVRDVDDINTSNFVLPPWATLLTANLEGVGFGDPCALGVGFSTGTPPDDNSRPVFRRSPNVYYDVVTPQGKVFTNENPSGSKEWEEFKIATGPVNPMANDAQADSLPAGIYQVNVTGMDLANLNGWRFFSDALGVTADGDPTPPLRPYTIGGVVCAVATTSNDNDDDDDRKYCNGKHEDDDDYSYRNKCNTSRCRYHGGYSSYSKSSRSTKGKCTKGQLRGKTYTSRYSRYKSTWCSIKQHDKRDCDGTHDDDDDGEVEETECGTFLANVKVTLVGDLDGDNVNDVVRTTTTDNEGVYSFPGLNAGSYTVLVTPTTLPSGSVAKDDFDGVETPNVAAVEIETGSANPGNVFFRYGKSTTSTTSQGVRTYDFWKSNSGSWPATSIKAGCSTYTRSKAIEIMKKSASTDMTYAMFRQLVAAKLNVAAGAKSSCIASVITAAENWLCNNKPGSCVSSNSRAWRYSGEDLHDALESYNKGNSCAARVN